MIDSAHPTVVYPDGFKPGCLFRKSRPGEVCPMAADRIKIIPSSDWAAAAAELGDSIRQKIWFLLNQGNVGSCATESTTEDEMLVEAVQGKPRVLLNPWFIYRVTSGGRDQGSSIDDNLAFVRENGIAPESLHPRSRGWQAKPSAEAIEAAKEHRIEEFYDVSNVNEFVSALLTGFAVVFGANGHSVLAVQHMGSYPLILNSWGNWEDHGFGQWCSYNAVNWNYGAFAVRVAS